MLKYTRFLFSYVFRKKTIFVVPLTLFVLFDLVMGLQINAAKNNNASFIDNPLSSFDKFYPFVFLGVFLAIIVIYLFKDSEKDGTDLIVLSKPISRTQVIFGKFLATYTMLVVYSLVVTSDFILVGFADVIACEKDPLAPVTFGVALGVGTLVIGVILTPFFIILGIYLSRTATLASAISFCFVTPVLSYIIAPLSGGYYGQGVTFNPSVQISFQDVGEEFENVFGQTSENDTQNNTLSANTNIEYIGENNETQFDDYVAETWYDSFVYVDFWYQLNTFYSLGQKEEEGLTFSYGNIDVGEPKQYVEDEIVVKPYEEAQVITAAGDEEEYVLYIGLNEYLTFLNEIADIYVNNPNLNANLTFVLNDLETYLNEELSEDYSITEVAAVMENIFEDLVDQRSDYQNMGDYWVKWSQTPPTYQGFILYGLATNPSDQLLETGFEPLNISPSYVVKKDDNSGVNPSENTEEISDLNVSYEAYLAAVNQYLYPVGEKITVLVPVDFMPTWLITIIWSTIGLTLSAISITVYYRRDFK